MVVPALCFAVLVSESRLQQLKLQLHFESVYRNIVNKPLMSIESSAFLAKLAYTTSVENLMKRCQTEDSRINIIKNGGKIILIKINKL